MGGWISDIDTPVHGTISIYNCIRHVRSWHTTLADHLIALGYYSLP
jgi:hypothetical protein